jgi:hypothetical protein
MKYNFSIEIIKTSYGNEILVMKLPDELSTVASYISNISKDYGDWFLEGFELVLSGREKYQERDGEFLGSRIEKDFTYIYDMFGGEFEKCTIETIELKRLIEAWLDVIM